MRGAALTLARLGFATLAVVAITYQFASLRHGLPTFNAGNFFSFFTIQTNVFAIAMLVLVVIVRPPERTILSDVIRGAVTLYIAITGVVFAVLLAGLQESLDTHIAWVDFTVHKLIPIVLVADWLLDPPRHRLSFRIGASWLPLPAWLLPRLHADSWCERRLVSPPLPRRLTARLRAGAPQLRCDADRHSRRGRGLHRDRQPARTHGQVTASSGLWEGVGWTSPIYV